MIEDEASTGATEESSPAPPYDRRHGTSAGDRRDLALKLWTVLSRAHSAVAEHSLADIRRHDLTAGEFGALEALYHKGPLLLGQLREKILVSSGGITYLVDRLTDRGLVERQPCPEDRRASYAALTPSGYELMARIFPDHARAMERAVSGLDRSEKLEAIRILKKLGLRAAELEAGRAKADRESATDAEPPGTRD